MGRLSQLTKQRTDVAIPDRYVSMHNALARGAQGLNLSQKRIIALALALTDSVSSRDALIGFKPIRLTATDYASTYGVDLTSAYEQLEIGSRSLLKTLWRTAGDNSVSKRPGRKPDYREGQWFSLAEYFKGSGHVDVTFHPELTPFLLALREQFSTYKLKQAAALRCIYAWRLFECMQSWKSVGRWTPDIDEFARAMDAPESCLADFGNMRKRVIEPAISDLKKRNSMNIKWDAERAGRKVVGLVFTIVDEPQKSLDL